MTKTVDKIYCCGCSKEINARLADGAEIYPHRPDLKELPFWKCDTCGNYVGCHHKSRYPTRPMGCIPTPEIRNARRHIHKILDPLWKSGKISRSRLYERVTCEIGWQFHTSEIRTLEDARTIYRIIQQIGKEVS